VPKIAKVAVNTAVLDFIGKSWNADKDDHPAISLNTVTFYLKWHVMPRQESTTRRKH